MVARLPALRAGRTLPPGFFIFKDSRLCQPRVIVKMIVEKQMECRLAGETEVLGKKPAPAPLLSKPATNRLTYGAACPSSLV
jgi:hypothetical protein